MRRAKRRLVPVDVIEQLNRDLPKVRSMLEDEREDAKGKAHSCALAEERVRGLHVPHLEGEVDPVWVGMCKGCGKISPCPTIRALKGTP